MRSQFHEENPYLPQPYLRGRTVVIEGAIGVGKTSLARLLADRWKCHSLFENFEDNIFLTSGFYEERDRYAFNTEIFFLIARFKQWRALQDPKETRVTDYFFDKNWIFSRLNLDPEDWSIYENLYAEFAKQVSAPDLVVYLTADIDTLRKRVYQRDRSFERSMSKDYHEHLDEAYKRYFLSYKKAPVLRINTELVDFVNNPQDLEKVASMIEERLQGHHQLSLSDFHNRSAEASAV